MMFLYVSSTIVHMCECLEKAQSISQLGECSVFELKFHWCLCHLCVESDVNCLRIFLMFMNNAMYLVSGWDIY